jgi:hypothetical protein
MTDGCYKAQNKNDIGERYPTEHVLQFSELSTNANWKNAELPEACETERRCVTGCKLEATQALTLFVSERDRSDAR